MLDIIIQLFVAKVKYKKSVLEVAQMDNLELKKRVFSAWARILYQKGIITLEECNRAISEYQKMKK